MQMFELTVKGMNCGHCEMAVKKAVASIAGTGKISVDLKTGKVRVEADSELVNYKQLSAAIEAAGYKVSEN